MPRATCPNPRRPGPVETVQPCRCLIALPDPSPRWRRTVGPAQPRGVSPDVPHGSQRPPPNRAPTAGVWRQGVRLFRHFPTPEPTLDYLLFPEAIRPYPDLWHAGGAPPNRRYLDRAPRPGHPLVRSVSDRIAMPRPHAPAHRGTDPPGVSQTSFHSPCMEREMPAGQRVRSPHLSTLNQFSSQTGACTPRPRPGSIPFEPQPITPSRRDRRARDRDNIPGEIRPPLPPNQRKNLVTSMAPKPLLQCRNQPVSRWHTQNPKIKVEKFSNCSGSIGTGANG